ncbi:MAG: 3-hydroxyacyl-CoA dehydrogenase [Frankiaceae bacterium]
MEPIAVVGAGAMGSGIAQVAAVAGHPVKLLDQVPGLAARTVAGIRERVGSLVPGGTLRPPTGGIDLVAADTLAEIAGARVVIEAVVEDLAVKRQLFAELEDVVDAQTILATNTSSLSPTAIAAALTAPGRLVGLHFFNPVPRMRLVEVVPGLATAAEVSDTVSALAQSWGKTVVRAQPTPGFLVNRLARPFYAEALRIYEERAADPATVDAVLTGAGGFRMGPFALMDFIGHDVNEAVTRSVWTAFGYDPRFAPSLAQRALVEAGWLGRKSGRGFYSDGPEAVPPTAVALAACRPPAEVVARGATPELRVLLDRSGVPARAGDGVDGLVQLPGGALLARCDGRTATELARRHGAPTVVIDRTLDDLTATTVAIAVSDGAPTVAAQEAAGLLQSAGLRAFQVDDVPGLVLTRTVAMLVNLAVDALHQGVASAADIDLAMRLGANHPMGPLEWGDRWGAASVLSILDHLQDAYRDPRYRPSPLLRRRVDSNILLSE